MRTCTRVPSSALSPREAHLALGQGLAAPVGTRKGALAAAPRLDVGFVHLGVDLVVALGGLLGGRVRDGHRPEW